MSDSEHAEEPDIKRFKADESDHSFQNDIFDCNQDEPGGDGLTEPRSNVSARKSTATATATATGPRLPSQSSSWKSFSPFRAEGGSWKPFNIKIETTSSDRVFSE